ncbi:MAG: ABC transporter substrate-binding protein [Pseudomonadota bacterium]|jgi:peptide/nickel transport system substrate-binding protein
MSFHLPTMTRRSVLLGSAALSATALLDGTAGRLAAAERRQGGTLTLLLTAEPPTITTIAHTAFNSVFVSAKATEGLLAYDFDLTPKPQLATAWSISPDGLRYTFTLRQGVKWHDGRDFTAEDVAFSLRAIKEVHPRGRSTFGNLEEVQTPDAHTVVLVLSKPAPYLISAFAAAETPIIPKHLYDGQKVDANPVSNAPVGTGPFVFKEWVRGSHIAYERNPNYWDAPKPYVDRLIIRFIPDGAARAAALETGEVQIAPGTPIPLSDVERLKALPNLLFETRGYEYTNSISRIEFNLDKPYFQDVRVRRAFAHAIDRSVIHKVVNYGYGTPIPGPFSVNLKKFYRPDLATYAFDPVQAEKLLDEAGLPRRDGGVRLRLVHDYVPSNESYRRGAEYIKQALGKVGVDISVRSQDFAAYTKRVYTDRDFDFTYNGMSNLFDPTVGVQRLYWSKNFKPGVPFSNGSHYADPEVDRLLEQAAVEVDQDKRIAQFSRFQELIARDVPDIGITTAPDFTIHDRRVRDHTVGADGLSGNLADVYFAAS